MTQRRLRGRSPLGGPSHSFGMTRVFVASLADITDNRRNVRVLSAQSRSDYLSNLRQRRAAMVRSGLCACIYLRLSLVPLAGQTRICRSAPGTCRRLHHGLRAVWGDHRWAPRLRFLLQTRNVARAAVDLSRLGRRNVQPRRNAWSVAFHFVLRVPTQNLVDKSWR